LEGEIDARGLLHLQFEIARRGLEPIELDLDGVLPRRQRRKVVQPHRVAGRRARGVGRLVHDRHSGARDDCAARIFHFPRDGAEPLGVSRLCEAQRQDNRNRGATHSVVLLWWPENEKRTRYTPGDNVSVHLFLTNGSRGAKRDPRKWGAMKAPRVECAVAQCRNAFTKSSTSRRSSLKTPPV